MERNTCSQNLVFGPSQAFGPSLITGGPVAYVRMGKASHIGRIYQKMKDRKGEVCIIRGGGQK